MDDLQTHDVAVASCDGLPGANPGEFSLPVPASQRENDFYLSLLDPDTDADSNGRSRYWLGITKSGNGAWQADNNGAVTFTNWNAGQGEDDRAFSIAAAMLKNNGEWLGEWLDIPNDARKYVAICTRKTTVSTFDPSVTFTEEFIGDDLIEYHYAGGENKMTFSDARQYCSNLGSSLATPDSVAENNHYAGLVDEYTPMSRFWIGVEGLSGTWARLDLENMIFNHWNSGQGNTGNVAVSTKTSLEYPDGPWNGEWESFDNDDAMVAHVFCRAFAG